MSHAGNSSENFKNFLGKRLVGVTYILGTIALEGTVIDLQNGAILSVKSSALQVACPPPGHRRKFRNFLLTFAHPLTPAVLLLKMLV
jgi:hypothetical protein